MEICGTPFKKSFGKPYKTSKESDWRINIKINGKKTKQFEDFKTRPDANEHIIKNDNKWFVSITDDGGNHKRDEKFDDKELAKIYVRESKAKEKQKIKDSKGKALDNETTFLDDVANKGNFPMLLDDNDNENGDPSMSEDIQQQLADHKDQFDTSLEAAETDAKSLLMSVAQLYLNENLIDDNNYIKFKMVIEQKGLSSLIFQLDIARKALFKLSERIHNGSHSPRNYEVLTQLQRVVLDVTKYQHEYLDDIEESMKNLAEDFDSGKMRTDGAGETSEVVENETGEISIISTNNRVKLLDDINKIVSESKQNKTPQSVNKNLYVEEVEDMTDAVAIKTGDEDDTIYEDEDITQLGLDTM